MDFPELGTAPPADETVRTIRDLDLERHVIDLEVYGVTVVPPEKVASMELTERLRDAVLQVHERRGGSPVKDYRTDDTTVHPRTYWLLPEDDAFQEAVTNPTLLALVRYLCGQSALLTSQLYIIKSATTGKEPFGLHNDTLGMPPPFSPYAHWCNASWILTDYEDPEDGPTVVAPGSHRWGRGATPRESKFWRDDAPVKPVPLKAKAGSLAVWHGYLWHGSIPRTKPGLRVTLVNTFGRQYMRPVNMFRDSVPEEIVERRPELRRVLALDHPIPCGEEMERDISRVKALERSQFA